MPETCNTTRRHRVAAFFAPHGIDRIEALMTDSHWSHTKSRAFTTALTALGADHITVRPHCPWQNGEVERSNRTFNQNGPTPGSPPPTTSAETVPSTKDHQSAE